jgi:hypothetical protein
VVPDIRNFEYGALSTLAVTPNLGLGEIRTWMDRLPPDQQSRIDAFYQRWTKLVRDNYGLWTKTYRAGDNPGAGAIEIYSHAQADHGFIFLINPNYWDGVVEIPLDQTLGFTGTGRCEIAELHPVERLRLTSQGPWPEFGTHIAVNVPAQHAVVLEVRPVPSEITKPRIFGLNGEIAASENGYLLKTKGAQGLASRFAVMLPKASRAIVAATVLDSPKEIDPRLAAPTKVDLLASSADGALLEVAFRRDRAPTTLRSWQLQPGSLNEGRAAQWHIKFPNSEQLHFPLFSDADIQMPIWDEDASRLGLGTAANFCGAYVDHAFSEMQETWIELRQGNATDQNNLPFSSGERVSRRALPELARDPGREWWFATVLNFPFIHSLGFEPAFDEHTIIVFPLLRQKEVKSLNAWINGEELNIQRYKYPVNHNLACHYADLTGTSAHGGENKLVVHLAY